MKRLFLMMVFIFAIGIQSAFAGSPQYRAISGVSMGGYGAMNIGLSHPTYFKTIACMGGLLDMAYNLKFMETDMIGNYDNPNVYPGRSTMIDMLQNLSVSFGNPVYYNPLSIYYPPGITSANARQPTTLLNFKDGQYNPDGSLPVITYEDPDPGDWVEVLLALDANGNGKRNIGEPILIQCHEPFTDTNGNGMYDSGEAFSDVGLDGVAGTGDYGEGDGVFTYNPRRQNMMAQDPLTHVETLSIPTLENFNIYIDAGTEDEFQFNIHTENFVQALQSRGLPVRIENGFPESFPDVSHFPDKRVYVRYEGGHVGFDEENIGLSFEQIEEGIEGALTVANRVTTLFTFVSDHFPGGNYGTNPIELLFYPSKMSVEAFYSRSLKKILRYGIYLPPGYKKNKSARYPVLYFLGGYNMSLAGMANGYMKAAFDGLILAEEMQKMIIIIVEGISYKTGSGHFYVNQIDPERGANFMDSFFDLVTFIDRQYRTK